MTAQQYTHLESQIKHLKNDLFTHPIYDQLSTINALKIFMSYHIFAVWDFMNLLSYLQSIYTCTNPPWQAPIYPKVARLINEIKLEEESDIIDKKVNSHVEFYIKAMTGLNINTKTITQLLQNQSKSSYEQLIMNPDIPNPIQSFLLSTYNAIKKGPITTAAYLTFGRETIIPTMYLNILKNTTTSPSIQPFKSYLERHIELDGESHSSLAKDLIIELCQNNAHSWTIAEKNAKLAIQARIDLYTFIQTQL